MVAWSFGIIGPLFKNQNCCCLKNHKKSKLCHKVIIFISLESSCFNLGSTLKGFSFFHFIVEFFVFFVEKKKKTKKIFEVNYGNSLQCTPMLCGHSTSTPDKQLNRQLFFFL